MIWLAWRQFRVRLFVAACAVLVLAVLVVLTRVHLGDLYRSSVTQCKHYGDCDAARTAFSALDGKLQVWLGIVVIAVPALLGIFWGAPLVASDLEAGTHRVAWTQSVTRSRWLIIKITLVTLGTAGVAGLVTFLVTWWSSLFDALNDNEFSVFDARDVVPVAYAVFAVALGVALGSIVRRTLPAMALTLVGFVGVRLAVYEWVRPRYVAALRVVTPVRVPNGSSSFASFDEINPSDWIVSHQTIDAAGHVIKANAVLGQHGEFGFNFGSSLSFNIDQTGIITLSDGQVCPNRVPISALGLHSPGQPGPPSPRIFAAMQACVDKLHIRDLYTYQPLSRYWPFQWYESLLFLALAVALGGLSVWVVRRKIA